MTINGEGNKFWSFNLGHLITIVVLCISMIGLYFRLDGRLAAVELLSAQNAIAIHDMDKLGTRKDSTDMEALKSQVNKIDGNVLWLMSRYSPLEKK